MAPGPLLRPELDRIARDLAGRGAPRIKALGRYAVRQWVARRLRVGRVLLAGDAAHGAFPVGGTAMNAGMVDAAVLADAIWSGEEAALDAYDASRRAWVRDRLLAPASELMEAMAARWPRQRKARCQRIRDLADDPALARRHLLRLSMLGEA